MLEITFDLTCVPDAGQQIADLLKVRLPLLLYGKMGVGKTTLTKQIVRALGCADEVTSPTFNIMQSYTTTSGTLWHVDLYRLDDHACLDELGLDEINAQNLLIIEWPERLGQRLFTSYLKGVLVSLADNQRQLILEKII